MHESTGIIPSILSQNSYRFSIPRVEIAASPQKRRHRVRSHQKPGGVDSKLGTDGSPLVSRIAGGQREDHAVYIRELQKFFDHRQRGHGCQGGDTTARTMFELKISQMEEVQSFEIHVMCLSGYQYWLYIL